jgi:hypothetical protein
MPRDIPVLIEPMLSSAGGPSPALYADGRKSSDDRPSCLENPRLGGAESTPTGNAASPFLAELRDNDGNLTPRDICSSQNPERY